MRIAILHYSLSSLGGAEKVCLTYVRVLNEIGVVPDVYTVGEVDTELIRRFMGYLPRFKVFNLLPFRLKFFGIYQKLSTSIWIPKLMNYDIVVNTSGVYIPLIGQEKLPNYSLYVYNPEVFKIPSKYRSGLWRLYYIPYDSANKYTVKKLRNCVKIIAVSHYTRLRVEKLWKLPSEHIVVIYPPVDVNIFLQVFDNTKRDGVITISRFTPEKGHLLQLEIAKQLPDIIFRICGSTKTPMYKHWFNAIRARAEAMNLKNVEFYPDISFKKLVELIAESKIFLHTNFREDFGIVTIEASAGGCVPVVPDFGGNVEACPIRELRYKTVEGAVKLVSKLHSKTVSELARYRRFLRNYVTRFSSESFKEAMITYTLSTSLKK